MTIETHVLALFEEGNPIPELDGLEPIGLDAAAYLATLEQRSSGVTQLETKRGAPDEEKKARSWWLVAAVAIVVTGVAILFVTQSGDTPVARQSGDPSATIQAYVTAYNAGDLDAVIELFAEDATVTGHPFAPEAGDERSIQGELAIRIVHISDLASAAMDDAYTVSNVEVTGNTVTWDSRWVSNEGEEFCAVGHSAVIEDGKISTWTWPSTELCVSAVAGQIGDPAATIQAYLTAYNAGNLNAIMELFAEESTVTGHPMTPDGAIGGVVRGDQAIRVLQQNDLVSRAVDDAYTVSNVEVTGNTVTWDSRWVSNEGEEFCAVGHSAVIEDGKISTWTWPSTELCS